MDVHCIVSGRNYDMLAPIIAQLLTPRPFPDLCRNIDVMLSGVGVGVGSGVEGVSGWRGECSGVKWREWSGMGERGWGRGGASMGLEYRC